MSITFPGFHARLTTPRSMEQARKDLIDLALKLMEDGQPLPFLVIMDVPAEKGCFLCVAEGPIRDLSNGDFCRLATQHFGATWIVAMNESWCIKGENIDESVPPSKHPARQECICLYEQERISLGSTLSMFEIIEGKPRKFDLDKPSVVCKPADWEVAATGEMVNLFASLEPEATRPN